MVNHLIISINVNVRSRAQILQVKDSVFDLYLVSVSDVVVSTTTLTHFLCNCRLLAPVPLGFFIKFKFIDNHYKMKI